MNMERVYAEIEELFKEHDYDTVRFSVDYDEREDGLYCHFTPYINEKGITVSDYLLYVEDTPVKDLEALKEFLKTKRIRSRIGCDWDPSWGKAE